MRTFHLPPPGGGFFFFSSDGRYLLKTLARREQRKLMRILPAYFNHLLRAPRTLLARLFGCYSITMHGQTRYFVVMASLFHGVAKIHEKYDLKGSWIDRSMRAPGSSPEESSATRLDNDLARKVKLPRHLGENQPILNSERRTGSNRKSARCRWWSIRIYLHI